MKVEGRCSVHCGKSPCSSMARDGTGTPEPALQKGFLKRKRFMSNRENRNGICLLNQDWELVPHFKLCGLQRGVDLVSIFRPILGFTAVSAQDSSGLLCPLLNPLYQLSDTFSPYWRKFCSLYFLCFSSRERERRDVAR